MPALEGAVQFRIRNTFVECWAVVHSDEVPKESQIQSCPARFIGRCLPRDDNDSGKDDRKALSRETTHSFTGSSSAGSDICGAEFSPGTGDGEIDGLHAWMSPTRAGGMNPEEALSDGIQAHFTMAPGSATTCSGPSFTQLADLQGVGAALGSPASARVPDPYAVCAPEGQLMQHPQCGGMVRVLRLSNALSASALSGTSTIPGPVSPPSAPRFAAPSVLPTAPLPPPPSVLPRQFARPRDFEASPQSTASPASKPSSELTTWGSAGHAVGRCKPCAFMHTVGCANGTACQFCHLCEPGEKRRRRKEKIESRKSGRKLRQALAGGRSSHSKSAAQ
jgi:hypothetical protein